jgi:hypothetical protein
MLLEGILEAPLVESLLLSLKKFYGHVKTKGVKRDYVYKVNEWTKKKEHGWHVYVRKILQGVSEYYIPNTTKN